MRLRKTLGCMAVAVGGLLGPVSSVSADHFLAGGVLYAPTSDPSETTVQCRFLGVKSRVAPGTFVTPTTIQCTVVHYDGPKSFKLSLSGTALEPFDIVKGVPVSGYHTFTLRGQMRSLLVRDGEGDGQRRMTERATLEAVGITIAPGTVPGPGAAPESLSLTLVYSARKDIGPLLAKVLGPPLATCDRSAATCTVTLAGPVIDGEMESHTTGGE